MVNYQLFTQNDLLYDAMLRDISQAKKSVYLETYIFGNDKVGAKFKTALTERARAGVEIKLLIDDFGSEIKEPYFHDLLLTGGQLVFFRKIIYSLNIITRNNNRDHRKLLIIDNTITYLGSSNIKEKHNNWHELNIRLEDEISGLFAETFEDNFKIANTMHFRKKTHTLPIRIGFFEIIRDVPSVRLKKIRKRKIELIRQAKNLIMIETPYFLPDKRFRKALIAAVRRKVEVIIILPKKSDVKIIDIIRNRYLGYLHNRGIKIYLYAPELLHAKFMVFDDNAFTLGSANINYRSLYTEFEINLFGWDKTIAADLKTVFEKDLQQSEKFDYQKFLSRSWFYKILEKLLTKIRDQL